MIGVDEVGRGAWAGVFLVAAVRINTKIDSSILKDSKQLSANIRHVISFDSNNNPNIDISYAQITAKDIDLNGLTWAQTQAMSRAVQMLNPSSDEEIILDGKINYLKDIFKQSKAIIKADSYHIQVMLASICAKVKRDSLMKQLDDKYPQYGFAQNKGYGTKSHRLALQKFGPIPNIHRYSYKSIKQVLASS